MKEAPHQRLYVKYDHPKAKSPVRPIVRERRLVNSDNYHTAKEMLHDPSTNLVMQSSNMELSTAFSIKMTLTDWHQVLQDTGILKLLFMPRTIGILITHYNDVQKLPSSIGMHFIPSPNSRGRIWRHESFLLKGLDPDEVVHASGKVILTKSAEIQNKAQIDVEAAFALVTSKLQAGQYKPLPVEIWKPHLPLVSLEKVAPRRRK